MEESPSYEVSDGIITSIKFGLATPQEICKSSISDCPITHPSLLLNPFLGLPLEAGRCESCGTAEPGQCEGHFGYIELPIPIYHPDHVSELKRMLSLLCLKCLKMKNRKFQVKHVGVLERMLSSCCEDVSQISINEVKTSDAASYLELKVPKNSNLKEGFWNFLAKYGYQYGEGFSRPLLPSEVLTILRRLHGDTRKKLSAKGYFPQEGYILQYLPVPPNCLSVPDISDGTNITSSDHSITMLRKVLRQIDTIKSSRAGIPSFEAHEVEASDLQTAVLQYLQFRGTGKASRDVDKRFGVSKEAVDTTTKAWLEKMKTLFIRKGSGFSSRSVITGDPYKGVGEIGLPSEIAQRITFEERVSQCNMSHLQKLVDEKLCLTYKDGLSTYSLREGSKGHTFLRPGQIVHRRIMDGDIVFVNRPPTTHKHSLQALSVYVHDDHTVKINPLICGPLSADFDGDCIHLFYPQSLAAKAEVVELFSVEKQLLSSHTGNFNLQLATDALLSLKLMFSNHFIRTPPFQQLSMFLHKDLTMPAVVKDGKGCCWWTASQVLEMTLPDCFNSVGDRHTIEESEFLRIDHSRDLLSSILNDIIISIYFTKGPKDVLKFFNSLQPILMEHLWTQGFSVSLRDFYTPKAVRDSVQKSIQGMSKLLRHLRSSYNESVEVQLEHLLRNEKLPIIDFMLKSSAIGVLIDSKSESALNKVVQQIGFLGIQISDKGKFYSKTLVDDMAWLFQKKYPSVGSYPSEEFGLVRSCLFYGLDPYQEMVHSISSREVIVRSTRGLTEPGTLFKNLMAILRDVVICYDGTVRNVSSNSIVQFEYGASNGTQFQSEFCGGDPVGVLAATAMSNPAYKAVLDSSPSSNSSWEMMKEILLSGASFKNDVSDRRVILYLNDCGCHRGYCKEKSAYLVKNQLKKVCLKDAADEFMIEYVGQQAVYDNSETGAGLVGHIRLNQSLLQNLGISVLEVLERCQENISSLRRRKKVGNLFKRISLCVSEFCAFCQISGSRCLGTPCLRFSWPDASDDHLERVSHILADMICPILLETVIKGDPRVSSANIVWISPDTMTWIRSPSKNQKGELALDIVLERQAVKQSGDAWRILLDSCLPVIHLIDTRRSIPYAIKQVQELLGISCAFEQAIQRLSTSVTMVTKGVLKDHLVLLANSMTCTGNLIGFNAGGIKALSRSLNVQIPFTEATLFTPRKCFERAAEKCHVDSLSSIVASCSWGKHVAVGTGSPFEVLWNTRDVELNVPDAHDVYNFLQLVRSSSAQEVGTSCLGAEVDELEVEDEDMELYLSPERDPGSDKPTFEDQAEFNSGLENENADEGKLSGSGWEQASCQSPKSGGGWDMADKTQNRAEKGVNQSDSWSSWGKKVDEAVDNPHQSGNDEQSGSWSAWGKKVEKDGGSSWGKKVEKAENNLPQLGNEEQSEPAWKKKVEKGGGSSWGKKVEETENNLHQLGNEEQSGSAWKKVEKGGGSSWGKKVEKGGGSSWAKKVEATENILHQFGNEEQSGPAWGKKVEKDGGSWMEKTGGAEGNSQQLENREQSGLSSAWGKKVEKDGATKDISSGAADGNKMEPEVGLDKTETWSSRRKDVEVSGKALDAWDVPKQLNSGSSWGKTTKDGGSSVGAWTGKAVTSSKALDLNRSECDRGLDQSASQSPWTQNVGKSGEGFSPSGDGHKQSDSWSSWGKGIKEDASISESRTEKTKGDSPSASSWNKAESPGDLKQTGSWASWGKKKADGQSLPEKTGFLHSSGGVASAGGSDLNHNSWDDKRGGQKSKSKSPQTWERSHGWGNSVSPKGQKGEPPITNWSSGISGDAQLNESGRGKDSPKVGGWDSPKFGGDESNVQPQWGKRRQNPRGDSRENSRGWASGSGGEWKNNRNHHTKLADDSNRGGNFTATRQRMDMFTTEEQDILSVVEPIMLSIRRITRLTGYNDGDPLSAEDQTYIVDNVFNYHPDKTVKMGAGLDYIMVSKHISFQDSRCFYVVSTDGEKQDFSARKCLENFVRLKYPDKAETFIGKYFKKPQPQSQSQSQSQPRPGWKREQSATLEETGTQQGQ